MHHIEFGREEPFDAVLEGGGGRWTTRTCPAQPDVDGAVDEGPEIDGASVCFHRRTDKLLQQGDDGVIVFRRDDVSVIELHCTGVFRFA